MSYVQGQVQYGIAAAQSDVPPSFSSSGLPRPINSSVQIVSLASNSATQQANGQISFSIPTGPSAGYLKNNSMYLKCKVSLANGANLTQNINFALPSASASSIINRLTVSAGKPLCQINNYHMLAEMLITHTTSKNFYSDDAAILQFTTCTANAGAANASPFPINTAAGAAVQEVVIPIICPIFNADKSLPLFLLNSPISVQFDLNSVASAFKGTAADVPNYSVSEATLVYEVVQPDFQFVQMVKAGMLPSAENPAGNLYQMNLRDFLTMQTASVGSLNYQIGANLSSVNGVLYTQYTNAPSVANNTLLTSNTQTNCKVLLDGRLINNFNLSAKAQIFAEMNRALGNMFDSNITSNCTPLDYLSDKFVGGVSTRRVSDVMAMTGTAAQNINLQLDSAGGNYNTYIVVLYDQILTVDAADER